MHCNIPIPRNWLHFSCNPIMLKKKWLNWSMKSWHHYSIYIFLSCFIKRIVKTVHSAKHLFCLSNLRNCFFTILCDQDCVKEAHDGMGGGWSHISNICWTVRRAEQWSSSLWEVESVGGLWSTSSPHWSTWVTVTVRIIVMCHYDNPSILVSYIWKQFFWLLLFSSVLWILHFSSRDIHIL